MTDEAMKHDANQFQSARTRIKICGLRDAAMARVAVEAGADAVGLVFVERSPRFVKAEEAKKIVRSLPAFVEAVGLFADQSADEIRSTCETAGISTVQLHGAENPEILDDLRGFRVIKAMAFDPEKFAAIWKSWQHVTHQLAGILLDTPPRSAGDLRGGSGHAIDWNSLKIAQAEGLFSGASHEQLALILAGGLTPANVGEAIANVQPFAVDVSSGVESSKGKKDATKIRAFCDAVRKADEERRMSR